MSAPGPLPTAPDNPNIAWLCSPEGKAYIAKALATVQALSNLELHVMLDGKVFRGVLRYSTHNAALEITMTHT